MVWQLAELAPGQNADYVVWIKAPSVPGAHVVRIALAYRPQGGPVTRLVFIRLIHWMYWVWDICFSLSFLPKSCIFCVRSRRKMIITCLFYYTKLILQRPRDPPTGGAVVSSAGVCRRPWAQPTCPCHLYPNQFGRTWSLPAAGLQGGTDPLSSIWTTWWSESDTTD